MLIGQEPFFLNHPILASNCTAHVITFMGKLKKKFGRGHPLRGECCRYNLIVLVFSLTFGLSSVAKGLSPPLQISQSVVPKLHLSADRLRLAGSLRHSGETQGILSIRTDTDTESNIFTNIHSTNQVCVFIQILVHSWSNRCTTHFLLAEQ